MHRNNNSPNRHLLSLILLSLGSQVIVPQEAAAEAMYIADRGPFEGVILRSTSSGVRTFYRRDRVVSTKTIRPIPRVCSLALTPSGSLFFCSGLDGHIMQYLPGGRERVIHSVPGQIRHLAWGKNELLYSVVGTPQNSEPLRDGAIYALDLKKRRSRRVFTIRQRDVNRQWWGAFAYHAGWIYLGTMGRPSKIYKIRAGKPEPIYDLPGVQINGIAFHPKGSLYVADGGTRLIKVSKFRYHTTALRLKSAKTSHVAFEANQPGGRGRGATTPRGTKHGQIVGKITNPPKLAGVQIVVFRAGNLKRPIASVRVGGRRSYRIPLKPGKYTVQVSLGKADSLWTVAPKRKSIVVKPGGIAQANFRFFMGPM